MNLGTFSASYVKTIIAIGEQYGVPRAEQTEFIGVNDALLSIPINRVASERVLALFHYVIARTGNEFFGLHVGDSFKPGTFDMLGHAIMCCEQLKHAVELNCRYQPLNQEFGISHLELGERLSAYTWVPKLDCEFIRPLNETVMAGYAKLGRWITWNDRQPIVKMHFTHQQPSSIAEYERIFATPVHFNMPSTQIIFDTDFLNTPLQQANKAVVELIRYRLDERMEQFKRRDSASNQLACYLQTQLGIRVPSLSEAAISLGYSERTLSRRLQDENTSYSKLVDSIRQQSARHYIRQPDLSLIEIAQLLGFKDQSAFTHAFRKWFSVSPAQFRRGALGA